VDPRAFAALTERFRASPAGRAADGSGRAVVAGSPRDDQNG